MVAAKVLQPRPAVIANKNQKEKIFIFLQVTKNSLSLQIDVLKCLIAERTLKVFIQNLDCGHVLFEIEKRTVCISWFCIQRLIENNYNRFI